MHSSQRSFQNVSHQSMQAIWDGLLVLKLAHQGPSKRLHSPHLLVLAALSSNLRKWLHQLTHKVVLEHSRDVGYGRSTAMWNLLY
jgi:hypothetical protein